MAGKYYAVKKGLKTGIFRTWEECKANVSGYSGASYKSFKTKAEAEAYLGIGKDSDFQLENVLNDKDCVKIYVDGSYNSATKEFSYGMV